MLPTSYWSNPKKTQRDTDDLLWSFPAKILLAVGVALAGLYLAGKCLRVLGGTIQDIRYSIHALKSS